MDTPAQGSGPPSRHKEFEDPHFHDDADFEADPDLEARLDALEAAKLKAKKPAHKLPPPRRRFEE